MDPFRTAVLHAQIHQDLPTLIKLFKSQKARNLTKRELYHLNICQRTKYDDFHVNVNNSILPKLINHLTEKAT